MNGTTAEKIRKIKETASREAATVTVITETIIGITATVKTKMETITEGKTERNSGTLNERIMGITAIMFMTRMETKKKIMNPTLS